MNVDKKHRLLIVDDQSTMRTFLRTLIDAQNDFEICGELSCATDIHPAIVELKPDVVLMDIFLPQNQGDIVSSYNSASPDTRGLSSGMQIKKNHPKIGVLFISISIETALISIIANSKHPGGLGFVSKNVSEDEILFVLRQVAQGRKYIDYASFDRFRVDSLTPVFTGKVHLDRILTDVEIKVLISFAYGKTRDQTAEALDIKVTAVDRHIDSIRKKLREENIAVGDSKDFSYVHMAHLAIATGLIKLLPISSNVSSDGK